MNETATDHVTRATRLIGVAIPTLRELRAAALSRTANEADSIDALRAAGYTGGDAVYDSFEQWLAEEAAPESTAAGRSPPDLTLQEFGERAAEYFRAAGWGQVDFRSEHEEGVASLTIENCWEAEAAGGEPGPSCHITTGMLAAFLGRLAGYPVSVMEIDCRSAGVECCQFLLGNSEVMAYKWEQLR